MSATHTVQDATGVIARADGGDILIAAGTTVPGDNVAGYATGCIFMETDNPGVGNCLHANIGTNSAANFNAVTVAGG